MIFQKSDIELGQKHFEERIKTTLGPVEMKEIMDDSKQSSNIFLIDVRNRGAFIKEHIPGAVNIPEEDLETRLSEIPKDKVIIVYCWTLVCHMAAHAGLTLSRHGYFVRELEGGIAEWKNYGYPVESGHVVEV